MVGFEEVSWGIVVGLVAEYIKRCGKKGFLRCLLGRLDVFVDGGIVQDEED